MSQQLQLAVIMFTDIVGYTELMASDREYTLTLLKINKDIHSNVVSVNDGKLLKELGDGILCMFQTATDALHSALELQKQTARIKNLKLRIGIHLGEIIIQENDAFGDGVNIAFRIQSIADPGGIFITESVHNAIRGKSDVQTKCLGKTKLKNVDYRVMIYAVLAPGLSDPVPAANYYKINKRKTATVVVTFIGILLIVLGFLFYPRFKGKPESDAGIYNAVSIAEKSIAVLPFINLSSDPEQVYFSDGMAEEVINALAHVPNLKVASRTSSFQFRGPEQDIKSIAATLGVSTILEGSVRKSEDRIRVSAQLINATNGFQLWSQIYERKLEGIFNLQDDLAEAIVEALQMQISESRRSQIKGVTTNLKAYNLYLEGRYFWNQRSQAGLERSIILFEQSIKEDSLYAPAYSALADAYNIMCSWGFLDPRKFIPEAKSAAKKALEIDSSLGEAYAAFGFINGFFEYKWEEAEDNLRMALKYNPNYAFAHMWLTGLYDITNRHDLASVEITKALELDPISLVANIFYARHLVFRNDYELALVPAEKVIDMNPNFALAHYVLYQIHLAKNNNDLAFEHFVSWRVNYSESPELLREGYQESGWSGAAKRMLPKLKDKTDGEFVDSYSTMALYYLLANQKDKALDFLELGYEQKIAGIPFLGIDPQWKPLREEPRYNRLLAKMNIKR